MTTAQERAIKLALNILHVGFFECPKHYYEYFVTNDEWALLMTAAGANAGGRQRHRPPDAGAGAERLGSSGKAGRASASSSPRGGCAAGCCVGVCCAGVCCVRA